MFQPQEAEEQSSFGYVILPLESRIEGTAWAIDGN